MMCTGIVSKIAILIWTFALMALVSIPGCSKARFVGVGYKSEQDLIFYIPRCRADDRVAAIRMERYASGDLLWGTRAIDEPRAVDRAGYEAPMAGYEVYERRSLASLVDQYGDERLRITVEMTSSTLTSIFTISGLEPDGSVDFSLSGPQDVDPRDVANVQREQCEPPRLPRAIAWALTVLAGALGIASVVMISIRARRRRQVCGP